MIDNNNRSQRKSMELLFERFEVVVIVNIYPRFYLK